MGDNPIHESHIHPLIKSLLAKVGAPREFAVTYRISRGPTGAEEPDSIVEALDLKMEDLSETAREALAALDSSAEHMYDWADLKWKLTAFMSLPDIFDSPFYDVTDDDAFLLFHQWYFYYESVQILREAILCGLNGFVFAANALLRPFLEFSLLQNYFYRVTEEAASLAPLKRYLATAITPGQTAVIKKAIPDDDFAKPIRFRIHSHLGGLSESTLHPYLPAVSVRQEKHTAHGHSFQSLHFWYSTRMIVEAALWVYYVNFPMLFHPVDVMRKFGCNGPVGVFIDESGALPIRKSLSAENFAEFSQYASHQQKVKDFLVFYSSQPDLTDSQIEATWWGGEEGEKFPGLRESYCATLLQMRAYRVGAALAAVSRPLAVTGSAVTSGTSQLSWWRALQRRK